MHRRLFLAAAPFYALAACSPSLHPSREPPPAPPPMPQIYDALPDEPHPVPAIPAGVVPERLWRQEVANPWPDEPVGSIVVDPDAGFLHLVETRERAMRYGAGVGAAGFAWSGIARLQFRRKWPVWKAPDTMIARRPEFAPYSVANGGMPGGPGNPLGARALYLFQNGEDTLYRIHGGCEPEYLGKAVSSGCIRLLDQDIIDLHDRVRDGVKVTVLKSLVPAGLAGLY
ncbi:MAG: L,D-transpeptidase [Paracoccaceae bacterium]